MQMGAQAEGTIQWVGTLVKGAIDTVTESTLFSPTQKVFNFPQRKVFVIGWTSRGEIG